MKKSLLLLLVALSSAAQAETLADTTKKVPPKPVVLKKMPALKPVPKTPQTQKIVTTAFTHPLSFQVEGGTQGVGADFRYGLVPGLSARLGGSFIPYTGNNLIDLPGFKSTNTISVKVFNIHLLADYVPFKKFRSLRLVGGGAYLYKADGGFSVTPTGSYTYGNTTLSGSDIGNLDLNVSWKGIAPYMGLGLFRSFPHHLFNINLDLGTYYLSAPQTHIVGTGLLDQNYKLEPQFDANLKDYRWLPVVQLNFNFKLK